MNLWIVRGLGMTFVHVVTRVVLGVAIAAWPLHGSMLRWLGLAVVVLVALLWAGLDGIRDARAHPSEREETDLTMTWLKAGAVAGLLAGAVCWLIGTVSDISLGENSLFFELTSGAAFTLLLVFVPAMLAVAVGRFIAHRDARKNEGDRDRGTVEAPVPVGVGAAGATDGDDGYGFAEGPYSDGAGSTDGHPDDDAPTEVFRAVERPKE
ncbi:B-4DMT family transporter [Rhodococcus gannanensis]|uniref:B-4DMT family transporter n=1 Tax=Rhodococcus gannanensis TaxID=1960308 RepID=A0ABW4P5Y3_9NOCA